LKTARERLRSESGTALVEAAIVFPCLLAILCWSVALSDVLVVRLKAAEAARYALWETTVWKAPEQIDREVQQRFRDLRSPAAIDSATTGLWLYPVAKSIRWQAQVETKASEVPLAGERSATPDIPGVLGTFVETVASWTSRGVQEAMRSQRFDTSGKAQVRVRLAQATAEEGVTNALRADGPVRDDRALPASLIALAFDSPLASQNDLQLVFDTWKAWARPSEYAPPGAPTDLSVSPQQTYPEVEKQVAAQVDQIAFFGMKRLDWFEALDSALSRALGGSVAQGLLGGRPPSIFSTARMDSSERGPITIRPAGPPDAAFVPDLCDAPSGGQASCTSGGQGAFRVGDVFSNDRRLLDGPDAYTRREDGVRSTIPHEIHGGYWNSSGGADPWNATEVSTVPLPERLARTNAYVIAWRCRGHFFGGSVLAQETDVDRRYRAPCGGH
jgi:hypothetical protein